ncbi:type I restriction enzyme M protein [Calothrix parasitica NIES-267]|uniref:site-specific DNA-methyltransferase (adenine-specific) n=1 Tax=Calothrix parasitica NIES-267 TaxID=1973488 RepID=A0A1Z4LLL9_9CYAN|nr:type I restriction enzyme M protein [Calothrix parasitica NIES-267]
MITGEIKYKIDRLWTTFWNNGISNPLSMIEQISYLLFIKRLDDLELVEKSGVKPIFSLEQQHYRWSYFKNLSNSEEMLQIVRDEVFPFIKNLGKNEENDYTLHMKDAVFLITNPNLLTNVVNQIDAIPMENRDISGDLYEYMLSKLNSAGTNGQFRTPRHIIQMIVELMSPGTKDIICDPACGTGGFLVAAVEYLRDSFNCEYFKSNTFQGFDFDSTMLRISSMNLMLHGIENPQIQARDSLSQDHEEISEAFTLIFANPPFKGSVEKLTTAKDLVKVVNTGKTELLFIALILRLLKIGGRAAVIVPNGVLFGSSKAHINIRRVLVEKHKLDAVISIPSGVFRPYAAVSTAVLIFTKTGKGGTDCVWFYDMKADGFSLDDKRQSVENNDIPDLLQQWKQRNSYKNIKGDNKAFWVTKEEIKENNYDLSINRYQDIEYEQIEYEQPKVILQKLRELENEICRDLDDLSELLK